MSNEGPIDLIFHSLHIGTKIEQCHELDLKIKIFDQLLEAAAQSPTIIPLTVRAQWGIIFFQNLDINIEYLKQSNLYFVSKRGQM